MSRASDVLGAGAPVWVAGKTYKSGDVLKSPADRYQLYVRTGAAGGGAIDPANDAANYVPFGGRAIKSVQRGITTLGGVLNVTISSVNPSKTFVHLLSFSVVNGIGQARARLTSSTNLELYGGLNNGNTDLTWEVVEWY